MNKKRESNLELLRIIAMLLIIAYHCSVHSECNIVTPEITLNKLWLQFLKIGGKTGVNIFILISGYYSINISYKYNNIKKILLLWIQIVFYAFAIFILGKMLGNIEYLPLIKLKTILPITFCTWWFASTYFVFCIVVPFLNPILKSLEKKIYERLLIIGIICWSIIPTLTSKNFQCSDLLWFIFLYSLAAYIRLWCNINTHKKYVNYASITVCITFCMMVIFNILGLRYMFFRLHATSFCSMYHLPTIIISVSLFLTFKNLNIRYNYVINKIASTTFGIYLIHDHPYMRKLIWITLIKMPTFFKSNLFVLYTISMIIIIFIGCSIIEFLRKHLLENIYKRILDKYEAELYFYITTYVKKIYNITVKRFFRQTNV